ncbi:MAG: Uma2 family endonuclease [bacterium]|nr:Uma2 family endonuclease [bacterium]
MTDLTRPHVTAAEFLALEDRDDLAQLLNGDILVAPPPIPNHQRTVFESAKLIESLIPNGEVFIAPIELWLDEENIPQPDVVWVAEGGHCVIEEKRLRGAPELIVEVRSLGKALIDKRDKYSLYERHGVSEYWIADAAEQFVEVYALMEGKYTYLGTFGPTDSFISPALGGRTVDLSRIFHPSKPDKAS